MPLCPADVSKLSRLLDEGMDMAPAQVEPWLAALPPEVAHLAPALRRMLGERPSRGAMGFLDQGPQLDDLPLAHGDGVWPGRQIGPHRVLRELGSGGMGSVWLAQRV
ncbi:MAG: hypothetical protein IV094_16710, partial [Vitreoscilla sp.]|nr:hypothetical protein [Vitreoscilla sp.]